MTDSVVVIFKNVEKNINVDLEVPLYITARELVIGLMKPMNLTLI